MEHMLEQSDKQKIADWLNLGSLEISPEAQRRGDFYFNIRKARNLAQWKTFAQKKMTISAADANKYKFRKDLFKDLMESSPFCGSPPFR